jgi:hypothetical protein
LLIISTFFQFDISTTIELMRAGKEKIQGLAKIIWDGQTTLDGDEVGQLDEIGFEAAEIGAQDVRLQRVPDEFAILFGADEARDFQLLHVVRERSGADVDAVAHVAAGRGAGSAAEFLEDFVAARVSEGPGNELDLVFGELYGGPGTWHN